MKAVRDKDPVFVVVLVMEPSPHWELGEFLVNKLGHLIPCGDPHCGHFKARGSWPEGQGH